MALINQEKFFQIINSFSTSPSITVVGDVGVDKYTEGTVSRISPEAPVPVLEVKKEWPKLGLAANVAHNLKTLGVATDLAGVIGDDSNALVLTKLVDDLGILTKYLIKDSTRHTTFKERITTPQQQICRVDYETLGPVSVDIENKLIELIAQNNKAKAIIIEDYAKGLLTQTIVEKILKVAKINQQMVLVDPGRTTPPLYYKGVDLLKPNWSESQKMCEALGFKETKLENIINILVDKLSLQKIVITLGPDGMASLDTQGDGKLKVIPTVANEVFDVSGAGDTVISVLSASLINGATLEEACWVANCAAGIVVAKRGTATVDIEELKEFYQKLKTKFH